ncbi:MAG: hypothetical protein WDW36_001369 [Sanguina aurantia]
MLSLPGATAAAAVAMMFLRARKWQQLLPSPPESSGSGSSAEAPPGIPGATSANGSGGGSTEAPGCGGCWHVYAATALMEHQWAQDPNIARNIFEKGLEDVRLFRNADYVLEYHRFLKGLGDLENGRALFERVLSEKCHRTNGRLWRHYVQFESEVGELPAALAVQKRAREALSGGGAYSNVSLAVTRHKFLDILPVTPDQAVHLAAALAPPALLTSSLSRSVTSTSFLEPLLLASAAASTPHPIPSNLPPGAAPSSGPSVYLGSGDIARIRPHNFPPAVEGLLRELPPATLHDGPTADVEKVIEGLLAMDLSPAAVLAACLEFEQGRTMGASAGPPDPVGQGPKASIGMDEFEFGAGNGGGGFPGGPSPPPQFGFAPPQPPSFSINPPTATGGAPVPLRRPPTAGTPAVPRPRPSPSPLPGRTPPTTLPRTSAPAADVPPEHAQQVMYPPEHAQQQQQQQAAAGPFGGHPPPPGPHPHHPSTAQPQGGFGFEHHGRPPLEPPGGPKRRHPELDQGHHHQPGGPPGEEEQHNDLEHYGPGPTQDMYRNRLKQRNRPGLDG